MRRSRHKRITQSWAEKPRQQPDPEKRPPLVSQGARTERPPFGEMTPDEAIRRALRGGTGNPWTPLG